MSMRLLLLMTLFGFVLQSVAVVLEKSDVSIGQLTVPEIEDRLQVRKDEFSL